ncbi:tyrosine-type recombinase/integrase [Nocardioides bruguierae]|uniref:Site-specific integrase n=1 Tax=Nocardioides bruguierae TaxID=2945102 RepID=A0A9X2DCX9_9ACTN|nr:tyrosine-type recombinase/integrase [Nocardioides bruguierae]MCM0622184.1 site-specific integrase [Nocardioides bruguierae]
MNGSLPALAGNLDPVQSTYLSTIASPDSDSSRYTYRAWLDRFLAWCDVNQLDPLSLKRLQLEVYIQHLLTDGRIRGTGGLKPSTVNTAFTPVRVFYEIAVDEELILRDPTRRLKLPKYEYTKRQLVPTRDFMLFLEVAKTTSPRHWACAALLSGLALRIHEVAALRVEDYLPNVEQGQHVLVYRQKGGKTARTPVPLPTLQALEAVRAGRTEGPLIPKRDGGQLTRTGAAGLVTTINRRAMAQGMKKPINPHLVRAMAITEAFEMGMTGRDVQAFARHADPRTTRRHYDLGNGNHYRHPAHQIAGRLAV